MGIGERFEFEKTGRIEPENKPMWNDVKIVESKDKLDIKDKPMSLRLEYAIGVMYILAGERRQQVFVINSESINDALVLTDTPDCRTSRYVMAGRIAKSEIEYTIPAAKSIEWIGTLLSIPYSITNPSRN